MSLTEKNKVDTNKYELTIHVDADSFEKAVEKAYHKQVRKINVPGFRQGKAPRRMVEKLYGEGVFYDDAINDLYPAALSEAVKEAELALVARPEVEATDVSKENGFTFKATCIVKPDVTVKEYKGLSVDKIVKAVAEEDVDQRIDSMRNRNARQVNVEGRASKEGDTLVFDFDGSVDGVPFDGGKAENYSLEIGSKQFIPGFEEQLVDRNIGDEFAVNVSFPEEYHAEELKGKAAVFQCKLHEVKAKELPELDDEFAKDVSEFDTLEELRGDIRQKMQEQFDKAAADTVENKLIDQVIEGMEAEIPQEMFEARIDDMVRDFSYRLESQGMNLDTYLQYTGMAPEAFRATFEEQSKRAVKIRLALEEIVKLEGIVPSEDEIEAEYQKAAENYKVDLARVKQAIPQEEFVQDLAVNKAIDLVKATAKVTEKPEEAAADEEKKAKKPARKSKKAEAAAESTEEE